LAKNYRQEVEKEEKLNTMKQDLNNTIYQLEQKIQRLEKQISDQRSSSIDQSPQGSFRFPFSSIKRDKSSTFFFQRL